MENGKLKKKMVSEGEMNGKGIKGGAREGRGGEGKLETKEKAKDVDS